MGKKVLKVMYSLSEDNVLRKILTRIMKNNLPKIRFISAENPIQILKDLLSIILNLQFLK